MNSKYWFFLIVSCFFFINVKGQGYEIKIELDNYAQDTIYLGYYLGGSQYLRDTAVSTDQKFVFKGEESLEPGVYIAVLPPDNEFFQVLVNEDEQHFAMKADHEDITATLKIKNSNDNTVFYDYLNFIQKASKKSEPWRKSIKDKDGDATSSQASLDQLNLDVKAKQEKVFTQHPNTVAATLIGANVEPDLPDFEGTEQEIQQKRFQYYKEHYFDHIDLSKKAVLRTPFLQERVDYYQEKLTYQTPDSLIKSIDYLLGAMKDNEDAFQYYLVQFLNNYAKSKIVGMDAVYVHLVDAYYANGKASWVEKEQLDKIVDNANTLRPILIGETAPNLTLWKQDSTSIKIHDIDADYTVMFFWDPDCGYCKKSMPKMIEFYNTYKDKGVEVLGICTAVMDKEKKCWDSVKEKGIDIWLNVSDKYLRSRYKTKYDVKTTPMIYVLDQDKKIVFKKIGAEQLPDVIEHLRSQESRS